MAKKELKMRAVVAPTQTVIVSAYDPDGKADACTLAFYMVSSHMQVTGEVKRILAEESILNENGRIVLEKLQPVIYDEEEGIYLGIGEKVADAFRPGLELKKALAEGNHE